MEEIKIGDKIKVMYSVDVNGKTVKMWSASTLIIGNNSNLRGINQFLNPFIGEDKSSLLTVGKKILLIEPEMGYGLKDNSKIGAIPKDLMSEGVTVGSDVDLSFKDGSTVKGKVKSENDDTFIVDCNHPLCGENLNVTIEVLEFI
tara:strand:+ start:35 stop:469 length:435 start_codon:yes stop_codon:yes gene_type:complete